ncbi:unnamed protein product [Coffea canephora]|uniref:Uncharacterized protein n=1 Tax=Coffea canephora TaxID=49390 RepID=A0A068TPS3_COFCA|nr:unnamed protein product [Coffea canephora]
MFTYFLDGREGKEELGLSITGSSLVKKIESWELLSDFLMLLSLYSAAQKGISNE